MKTLTERVELLYQDLHSTVHAQRILNKTRINLLDVNRSEYVDRFPICRKYGFVVPTSDLVEFIDEWGPIVEVGAGTGNLSSFLRDSKPTDPQDGEYGFIHPEHVEKMSAIEAAAKYRDRTILCAWPSYDEPWAYELLKSLTAGRLLIYIGESHGGCTADENFHNHLDEHCEKIDDMAIANWPSIHDYLTLYKVNVK